MKINASMWRARVPAGRFRWRVGLLTDRLGGSPTLHPGPQGRGPSIWVCLLSFLVLGIAAAAQPLVKADKDGRLAYTADANGNRVIDFSTAGYASGDEPIPFVPAKIVVEPDGKNDRARIQAALDLVAAMPRDAQGFRGAVLLKPGRWLIDTSLRLKASGVVLRGSGADEKGTILVATGTSRRTLLEVGGTGQRAEVKGSRRAVTDAYVPVGAVNFSLENTAGLSVGDRIIVHRPCTAEWAALLDMDKFAGWRADGRLHWRPGSRDIFWDRAVTAIEGNRITIDAPVTTALDQAYGGASVYRYEFPGRIDQVGVENLRCVSEHPGDREEHAWVCVSLDKVENAWVRQVTARHFVSYVVNVQADALRVTVEDCAGQDPVSELASLRRRVFSIGGQLTLVRRCSSNWGLRDFTTGFTAAGPNVFLQCTTRESYDYSGPVESWASGMLFDNVIIRGNALRLFNRGLDEQGSGWAAANSILWNCEATDIQVQSPPGAFNVAYGCRGDVAEDRITAGSGDSALRDIGRGGPIKPASLYLTQLAERKNGSATPAGRQEISLASDGARLLTVAEVQAFLAAETAAKKARGVHPLKVEHARFTIDGQPAWTAATNIGQWFQGQMARPLARSYGPALTRFAPGETGLGLTDNLEEVADAMPAHAVFNQHYGLWYERRRVNHNFYGAPEHKDGNVWGPFQEMPWARSGGEQKDWNGLSRYDLTRFNPWYFSRLKEFADICDARGLILRNDFYFQHALQETRAHYVDFPWRPVNCLQDTGLPDENPAASTFYDVSHAVRRDLHRRYIRHTLDVLGYNSNVVFGLDQEYSGPLSFVQFWLDTIAEWQQEHKRKVFVCLGVPKDQMDAILADPARAPLVTAIDFHYWFYRPDGSLYTIVGGINRAPREQSVGIVSESDLQKLRDANTNPTWAGSNIVSSPEFQRRTQTVRAGTPAMRYRALREYRDSHPDLVIPLRRDDFPELTAALEEKIPAGERAATRPMAIVRGPVESAWAMAAPGRAYLVYTMAGQAADLDLTADRGVFNISWLDSASGELRAAGDVTAGKLVTLAPPAADTNRPWIAWLTRSQ
ncbi:MAG TPA: DUF6298 domain-containing protein [Lacunisphaera sp.]|nr:DUF6298 domain-containing protein [Lacunisphaera sp.]